MNKRGEVNMFGIILVMFMAIIVGVVLFQVVAQEVGRSTTLETVSNVSVGVLSNGTTTYITAHKSCSDFSLYNATEDFEIPSNNYTVTNNVVHNGALTISIEPALSQFYMLDVAAATYNGECQPLTYIPDSGSRAVAGLIIVFFALAIAVVALEPTLRSGVIESFGR